MCILSVLLKVVGYYDECSVHVSDGLKKMDGVGGIGDLYPFVWDVLTFF